MCGKPPAHGKERRWQPQNKRTQPGTKAFKNPRNFVRTGVYTSSWSRSPPGPPREFDGQAPLPKSASTRRRAIRGHGPLRMLQRSRCKSCLRPSRVGAGLLNAQRCCYGCRASRDRVAPLGEPQSLDQNLSSLPRRPRAAACSGRDGASTPPGCVSASRPASAAPCTRHACSPTVSLQSLPGKHDARSTGITQVPTKERGRGEEMPGDSTIIRPTACMRQQSRLRADAQAKEAAPQNRMDTTLTRCPLIQRTPCAPECL